MTGSEYIIEYLIKKNAKTLFGYPGASVLKLYDSIYCYNRDNINKINHIMARHEQGAINMSIGYAKASGRPGICIATSGPGATNLTTGIADAYLDSIPLLIITGQVQVNSIGRDAFQEADIMGVTIPISKHNYLVKNVQILPHVLEEAWRICTSGRKGPVLVDISSDVFSAEIDIAKSDEYERRYGILPRIRKNEFPLETKIGQIIEEITHSYRPLILAGGGVVSSEAGEKLSEFAIKNEIPVATTLMGMSLILDKAVNMLGMTGKFGTPAANAAIEQCDTIIAVGTRFSDRTIGEFDRFSRSHFVIHCDIDQAELSKNVNADIAVACNAGTFFDEMLKNEIQRDKKAFKIWNDQLKSVKENEHKPIEINAERLSCREILSKIDEIERDLHDAIYVTDVGNHQMTAAWQLEPRYERGFITSGGLGAMGFGLPGAIGAAIAVNEMKCDNHCGDTKYAEKMNKYAKQIILICGDGGFQMTEQELSDLEYAKIPIKIFIMDNSSLGMIRTCQRNAYDGRLIESEMKNPEFVKIGEAYGVDSRKIDVSDREMLYEKLKEILISDHSILVHCIK